MKTEALKQTQRLLTKVFVHPRVEPCQGEQLRRLKREIEKVMGAGKVDEERLGRALQALATVLLEIVKSGDKP
jgi:hypothetical protein